MSFLPQSTYLGKLELIEAYEFYDHLPILFACRNASSHIFLAVLVDEEDDFELWLYVGMSPLRFQQVRSGVIDLHHAFAKGEDGIAFIIQTPYDETQNVSIRHMPSEIISADWLPLPGEFLNLDQKAVPQLDEKLTIKELQAI